MHEHFRPAGPNTPGSGWKRQKADRAAWPKQSGRHWPCQKAISALKKALAKPGLAFICECKKASPSKGLIAPDFPYLQIAKEYEAAGADAISVLTEPKWFLGRDAYLKEITSCRLHALPAQGLYRG